MSSPLVGLGMSGGGFRASLYHLGTLAALAEAGVLLQQHSRPTQR